MDKDRSGVLNIDDIKDVYNGKKHPDVIKGKKTEEEVLGEFLDTFEAHYSLNVSCNCWFHKSFNKCIQFSMRDQKTGALQWMNGLNITIMCL